VQVAEIVIERPSAGEHKRDVVILLDSITRLARAYNTVVPHFRQDPFRRCGLECAPQAQAFFGAARNIEEAELDYHRNLAR